MMRSGPRSVTCENTVILISALRQTNGLNFNSHLDKEIRSGLTHCDTNTLAAVRHSPLLHSTSPTWKSIVRFLSASEGWTWFGALAWRRRVETMTMPSPGFLCILPTMLLQRVRNSWGSSNPESSWMDSGNTPRRLLWLPLLRRPLPGSDTSNMNSHIHLENHIATTFSRFFPLSFRYWSSWYSDVLPSTQDYPVWPSH